MRRWIALAVSLTIVLGCSRSEEAPAPPPPPVAELSTQELIAIENRPGSTPPLTDTREPAPAALPDLPGTPGPSPAFGPADAPVYVYVLSDFQCPVCRRIVEPLKHLARRHPKDVRLVVKHNALATHGRAAASAAASLAAFRQGKFWAYFDRLFANHGPYDDESLVAHAQALGLDIERFRKDMADPSVMAQVEYESALAAKIELPSTPSFVINGMTQTGWGSYMGVQTAVERELARARQIATGGAPAPRVAYEATRQSGPKGEQLASALFP